MSLTLRHVSHRYGDRLAVENVGLDVAAGEIFCLLGPSGCGKSTTLRIAAGLEALQQGEVHIGGKLVAGDRINLPAEDRRVGMVFQDHALFPHLTVRENIAFGLSHMSAREQAAIAGQWAERLSLSRHLAVYPHSLSGGEQQRVALARAMAPQPAVMLLDEPFSSLDNRLRDRIRDDTVALLQHSRTPTLLVTHDPEEAMRMADHIGIMQDGRLVQVGTPEQVYARPATPFVMRFLAETNEWAGRVQDGALLTPWGAIAAKGLPEGAAALAMFRPESLFERDDAPVFRVIRDRVLGPFRRVEVAAETGQGAVPENLLVARLPPGPPLIAGSTLKLAIDRAACIVFSGT
ncbi:ABC transporter ATP-binding protein [Ferrovibrio sp.]|uniref:ABC transporter ATP-binding protein n=1 Tax=Ferrovibrio sp. TaxID=1917215 RepID=UPI0025BA1B3C|nr:ABC transporter ATP-binding protein [Ferrovibrio sp.]MBX3454323.1 ABC transporter ATP-binding protein [Ferrovibrio sp.]